MSTHRLKSYRPSGKIDISLSWKLVLSLLFIIALSFVGSSLVQAVQVSYLGSIVFLIQVTVTGFVAGLLVRWGHIRNIGIAILCGGLLGLTALYFSWIFSLPKILATIGIETSSEILLKNPGLTLSYIAQSAQEYSMSFVTIEFRHWLLKAVWLAEVVIVIIYPIYKTYQISNSVVFCEACHEWVEKQPGLVGFYHSDEQQLKTQFLTADYDFMDQAEAIFNVPMKDYYCVDGEVCVGCNDFFILSLRLMKKATDQDKAKRFSLTEKLVVARPYFQHFLLLTNQFPAPEEE
ncbi:hypothetical protein [Aliikangiella coralliicola]|uniref:Uncharacterized protein n=1 Tax=Aliikangiella coralliicola TaxID=2592383 RepID=A0A545UDL7_9GAMM|nr:hypothetical protein [Aliikangiella coralliicola]TQV87556.1 hypothetical protein FLL46_11840 [Aliikangiella coralliicola]